MWAYAKSGCALLVGGHVCSDRVRIFRNANMPLIYNTFLMALNLAKVGVEGSNPFARSSFPDEVAHCRADLFAEMV